MRVVALVGILSFVAACGSSEEPVKPLLSDIQQKIFSVSCTFSVCHDASAKKGNLDLSSAATSFAQLVGVAADDGVANGRGKIRVVAGSADTSFLVHKLDQSPALLPSDEGDPMPQTGVRLPQQKIDAIREWIANGALNN